MKNCELLLWFLLTVPCFTQTRQEVIDSWEPTEEAQINITNDHSFSPFYIINSASKKLITLYQKNISPKSTNRCPFYISCSQFAKNAITKYGIGGIPIFIDRFFYRENLSIYYNYKLVETNGGIIKFDDTIHE